MGTMTTTDTPRTDAVVNEPCAPHQVMQKWEKLIENSRQLELELNELWSRFDKQMEAEAEVERLKLERDHALDMEQAACAREAIQKAEVERLKSDKTHLITQCANLLEDLSEIKETYASIVQQPHFDEREVHCSCVPALRAEVERLKALLKSNNFTDHFEDIL